MNKEKEMTVYSELDGNERALFIESLLKHSQAAKAMSALELQKVGQVLHQLLLGRLLVSGDRLPEMGLPGVDLLAADLLAADLPGVDLPGARSKVAAFKTTACVNALQCQSDAAPQAVRAKNTKKDDSKCVFGKDETLARIEEAMTTVRQASCSIMDAAEAVLEKQEEILAMLEAPEDFITLFSLQEELITKIIVECSFDDLTGQRLKAVEQYVLSAAGAEASDAVSVKAPGKGANSSGKKAQVSGKKVKASNKAFSKTPNKALASGALEKKECMPLEKIADSALKGPTLDADQNDVDDLLSRFGV